jgi:CheY-like chemotaxis protein
MKKLVLLAVDDHKESLHQLEAFLRKRFGDKYRYEVEENPMEALSFLNTLDPVRDPLALVISDHIMPQMNGDDFLIRLHQRFPKTVKILFTGQSAGMDAIVRAINQAALYSFIPKPWEEEKLFLTINQGLHKFNLEAALEEERRHLHTLLKKSSQDVQSFYSSFQEPFKTFLQQFEKNLLSFSATPALSDFFTQAQELYRQFESYSQKDPESSYPQEAFQEDQATLKKIPPQKKILIVEYSPFTQEQLKSSFQKIDWNVLIEEQGERVLEVALRYQPDFILLALHLPHLSSWEVLNQLQTHPQALHFPVIVTAYPNQGNDRARAMVMGARDLWQKPLSPEKLYDSLSKLFMKKSR